MELYDGFLAFADVLDYGGVDGQVVADDERPQGLPAGGRKAVLPQRLQNVGLDAESTVSRFFGQSIVLLAVAPAAANGLNASCDIAFFLGFSPLVVPVPIPKGEYFSVPHIFNNFIIDGACMLVFQLFSAFFASLDEDGPEVVDPLRAFFGGPGLEVERALCGGDSEAQRIELLGNLVSLHHDRPDAQSEVGYVLYVNEPRLFPLGRIAHPLDFLFVFAEKDLPLHKFIGAFAHLEKDVALHELFAYFDGLADVRDSEIFQPAIYCGEIVRFSLKLFLADALIDIREVFFRDGGARPSCIFHKFLAGHLAFLFGVVSIGREHDDSVGQWEQFVRIIIGLNICLIESKGELPNDSLDLLRLAGQSKLAEEYAHGLVELLPVELHQFAV